ncbi:MAG: ABC transporter permease subunit, partial [Candidatus Heimdallarchaeaceae archaeon]
MQIWAMNRMRKSNSSKLVKSVSLLILLFISINLMNTNSSRIQTSKAQNERGEIVDIADRFIIINWTTPHSFNSNSFIIELQDITSNVSSIWSIIRINGTYVKGFNSMNLVNFTDSPGNNYQAQKESSYNFTYYVVPEGVISVQVKVNGLKPSALYLINIYSSNTSLSFYEGLTQIKILDEELYWSSMEFETLQSPDEALKYSKTATTISLLIIMTIFLILFIILARIDVPFNKIAYVFIFPALFALVLLEIYPILYGIILSFTSYHLKRGEIPQFNWLENYFQISTNPQLPIVFTTSLVWSTIIIFFKIFLGFLLAYIIQYKVKRKKVWYLMLYLPWVIPSYIKILSWRAFIHGNAGNSFFNFLFGTNVNLVNQPYVALFVACFVEVWDSIPLVTTLFLGGLSSIPRELKDMAEVDQISERTNIRRVVIPLIKPIILPAIILEIIKTFGSFNVVFLLTNGYPLLSYGSSEAGVIGATDLFSTFTFYMFYHRRDVGIAAAYSTIMSLLTLFFVIIWVKMSKGAESAYRPEKEKKKKKHTFTLSTILLTQAIGYILAAIFQFRYFGFYWCPMLNYILAFTFLFAAISLCFNPNSNKNLLKLLFLMDLILSFSQFFMFQMWYAFNWNIFIVGLEFFLISNYSKEEKLHKSVISSEKIKETYLTFKSKILHFLRFIDSQLVDLNSIHGILLFQTFFLFLSNIILKASSWVMWGGFSLVSIIFVFSSFSDKVTTLSIISQPIIWVGLCFGWEQVGWKISLLFLSLMYIINYLKHYVTKLQKGTAKLSKAYLFFLQPTNSSLILLFISAVAFIPVWIILWIAFSPSNSIVPTGLFPTNPTIENFKLLFSQESILLHFSNSLLVSLGSASLCIFLTVLAAYAFSRYNFKAKKEMMVGVFILKMFTGILTLIPLYLIMYNLGLIDTYMGVILAYSTHTIPLGLW